MRNTTETIVAKALEDLKAVLTCQRKLEDGRTITLRFVKCEELDSRKQYNDISSTIVRGIVVKQSGIKLREALDWTTLSADLLWQCKASWIGEAKLGTSCSINFQPSAEDLLSLEEPPSDEEPPSFDEPRSLEELGLVKVVTSSPSAEEPPPLEDTTSHEVSPSIKEPQTLKESQMPKEPSSEMNKKRRFSETGLEAEVEIRESPVGGGHLAEDPKV